MNPSDPDRASAGGPPAVHRLSAFTDRPDGGNPAGVVITEDALAEADMLRIAADVGYSETAFLVPVATSMETREATEGEPTAGSGRRYLTRYFSPEAEVSFCGHATIASAVLLGSTSGPGTYTFETGQGPVPVEVARSSHGLIATLTSVQPRVDAAASDLVGETLEALGWSLADLASTFDPAVAYAGARHLVLMVASREILAKVAYDFPRLRAAMARHDLTTVALVYREDARHFHARNLFPPGGVTEDPATGAAAAAFGAYLRDRHEVSPPATIQIEQGTDMGRPSRLRVHIPPGTAGIEVAGTAVTLPG